MENNIDDCLIFECGEEELSEWQKQCYTNRARELKCLFDRLSQAESALKKLTENHPPPLSPLSAKTPVNLPPKSSVVLRPKIAPVPTNDLGFKRINIRTPIQPPERKKVDTPIQPPGGPNIRCTTPLGLPNLTQFCPIKPAPFTRLCGQRHDQVTAPNIVQTTNNSVVQMPITSSSTQPPNISIVKDDYEDIKIEIIRPENFPAVPPPEDNKVDTPIQPLGGPNIRSTTPFGVHNLPQMAPTISGRVAHQPETQFCPIKPAPFARLCGQRHDQVTASNIVQTTNNSVVQMPVTSSPTQPPNISIVKDDYEDMKIEIIRPENSPAVQPPEHKKVDTPIQPLGGPNIRSTTPFGVHNLPQMPPPISARVSHQRETQFCPIMPAPFARLCGQHHDQVTASNIVQTTNNSVVQMPVTSSPTQPPDISIVKDDYEDIIEMIMLENSPAVQQPQVPDLIHTPLNSNSQDLHVPPSSTTGRQSLDPQPLSSSTNGVGPLPSPSQPESSPVPPCVKSAIFDSYPLASYFGPANKSGNTHSVKFDKTVSKCGSQKVSAPPKTYSSKRKLENSSDIQKNKKPLITLKTMLDSSPNINTVSSSDNSSINIGTSNEKTDFASRLTQSTGENSLSMPELNCDLTKDSDVIFQTSNNEIQNITRSKVKDKVFPSLVVSMRASLSSFSFDLANRERGELNENIRKVLLKEPAELTEYLLQQRLLRSKHVCKIHSKPLKLGMYSNTSRSHHSGGYIWISDCCPREFTSVFSGSIFDRTWQSPKTILKLMYHWACNTSISNVVQWVNVDQFIIKTYYTYFRAVCQSAVHEKIGLMGGQNKVIQVGVISLGTTSAKNNSPDVKVNIMGALNSDTKQLRLNAFQYKSDEDKTQESQMIEILEMLKAWIDPKSTIVVDFNFDRTLFDKYGFYNVAICSGRKSKYHNSSIMNYLKTRIPCRFQSTLNHLSFVIIQQFLDELVWRETWGQIPSRAHESLIKHISELTQLTDIHIITKLKRIASNPVRNFKPPDSVEPGHSTVSVDDPLQVSKTQNANSIPAPSSDSICRDEGKKTLDNSTKELNIQNHPPATSSLSGQDGIDKMVLLEPYYYGTIAGDTSSWNNVTYFNISCDLCNKKCISGTALCDHLIHHALNDNNAAATLLPEQLCSICKVCLKKVDAIQLHKIRKHPSPLGSCVTACKICNVDYKTRDKLISHMHNVHCKLEMPYYCELCHFRTSSYDCIMYHFDHKHNKVPCIQCPFCLKVVYLHSQTGVRLANNQNYFIQHIQKHCLAKLNKKCEKCMLSFINSDCLTAHKVKFHVSGKCLEGVVPTTLNSHRFTMMKTPKEPSSVALASSRVHVLNGVPLAPIVKMHSSCFKYTCAECEGPFSENHLSKLLVCANCSFKTCCANAIKEHHVRQHRQLTDCSTLSRPQLIGCEIFREELYTCRKCQKFNTNNGNKLCAHMVKCGAVTAIVADESSNGNEPADDEKWVPSEM